MAKDDSLNSTSTMFKLFSGKDYRLMLVLPIELAVK